MGFWNKRLRFSLTNSLGDFSPDQTATAYISHFIAQVWLHRQLARTGQLMLNLPVHQICKKDVCGGFTKKKPRLVEESI